MAACSSSLARPPTASWSRYLSSCVRLSGGQHDDCGSRHYSLSHIRHLEAESIHVMREVVAEFERPVLLYSVEGFA